MASPTNTLPCAQDLADEFSALLLLRIGDEAFAEVVARNQASETPLTCASHDFCDANMIMFKALENLVGGKLDASAIVNSTEHTNLWNEAWSIAKSSAMQALISTNLNQSTVLQAIMSISDEELEDKLDQLTINDLEDDQIFPGGALPSSDNKSLSFVTSVRGYKGYDIYVRGDAVKDYGPHEFFFYADDGSAIGYARLTKSPQKASINMIAFLEEHRGWGNGKAFYEYLLSELGLQIESDHQITYATARLYQSLSKTWGISLQDNGRVMLLPTPAERYTCTPNASTPP